MKVYDIIFPGSQAAGDAICYDPKPIIEAAKKCVKPIFFATIGHIVYEIRDEFEQNRLPTYRYGERIARVLHYMWKYQTSQEK